MKELKLIPPNDPRVQTAIAPFKDDMLKEHDFKDRKELTESMFECMKKFQGIGLTCNQVGLPFNMFVLGDHPQLENGLKMACFNPMIISSSEETTVMKEGCLTFPFLFLIAEETNFFIFELATWLSLIKKGDSIESTNSREAVGWWADAYSIEPTRPEAIYRIVKRWRYMGRPKVCFEWLARFNEANMPDDVYDGIEREVWEWRLSEERLICAFYCGIQEVQRDIMNILNKCISSHSIQQALKNYFFYDIRIFSKKEVKLDIADYVKIGDNTEVMMYGSTPSICYDKQGYIVNQRLVSYLVNSNGSYNLGKSETVTTVNRRLKLNRQLELIDKFLDYTPSHINDTYNGVEDVKLWRRRDGSLCFLGTHIKNNEPWNDTNICVCMGNYNNTDLKIFLLM